MAALSIVTAFLPLLIMLVLFSSSAANRQILVGGKQNAWTIPPSSNDTLNHWAEETRFKVGDILMWKYNPKTDSVLQVTKEDYDGCNTSNPIKEHKNGLTMIELDHSGPFCFISGAQGNCEKGEKLIVVVLSQDHWPKQNASNTTTPVPSPAPGPRGEAHGLTSGVLLGAFLMIGLVTILAF